MSATFENPLSFEDEGADRRPEAFEGEPLQAARAGGKKQPIRSPKAKSRVAFGVGTPSPPADLENPIDGLGDMTTQQVIGLFKSLDLDGNGVIDAEEMAIMMTRLGKPADEDSVNEMMMIMDINNDGAVELEEFILWWQKFGRFEHQSLIETDLGYARAAQASRRIGKTLTAPLRKAKHMVVPDVQVDTAQKGVTPESLFVVDKTANDANRQLGEASELIHKAFERDFHHLEDVITGQAGASHWLEPWESEAAAEFNEQATLKALGWPPAVAAAARELFEKKERLVSYRLFLQSDPLAPSLRKKTYLEAMNKKLTRQRSPDPANDPTLMPTVENVRREALSYLEKGLSHDEKWLDAEAIPFESGLRAIRTALATECKYRQSKMLALKKRIDLVQETPRKLIVTGYVQQLSHISGGQVPHYCFFDMQHERDTSGKPIWTNGCWIIGPTLNAERCTCWLPQNNDTYKHPVAKINLSKAAARDHILGSKSSGATVDPANFGDWQVFDTIAKGWASAPGTHCPAFGVDAVEDESQTMREYISKAIEHEERMLARAQETMGIQDSGSKSLRRYKSAETLELTLAGHKTADGKMTREGFYACGMQYYQEEVSNAQSSLRQNILSSSEHLPFLGDDPDDRRELVDEILTTFVWSCVRKIQARKLEKRKFVARLERPTLSRAFFSWKFHWRQNSASAMITGGTFAEPTLPWNVRHPRSTFSNWWEGAQGVLLIYVSFNVIWRVTFNTRAEGFYYYFESLVDIYFVLNLHTAFYDRSGDLQGLHPAGRGRGFWNILACNSGADLKRLYIHYARGWMFVDVVSVFPLGAVYAHLSGTAGGADEAGSARVLKMFRLLRLMKLLRVFRGMRILKKYEDKLGPGLSAAVLIGTVVLAIHAITCMWYFAGTINTHTPGGSDVPGDESSGWVEAMFTGSARLCSCYNGTDSSGEPRPFFFDAFQSKCMHPNDLEGKGYAICSGKEDGVPTAMDYYYKALFTSMTNTSVKPGYLHSVWELFSAAVITGTTGFMWGAVAGAWSSIFQANQLAGQKFNEKMTNLKEFCRIKGLDWGTRSKLVAYYEHLHPERVIVDEDKIMEELPPGMRVDLVKQIYGPVIASVPLFFGLGSDILTEICLSLGTLPTLKGEVLLREGTASREMYCISEGSCRVTQHMRGGEDEERVRIWIEEVFAANYSITKLYEPNQKILLEKFMKRMKVLAQESADGASVSYRQLVNDQKIIVMLETPRALMEATATLNRLLALAKEQGRVQYRGALRLESAVPAAGLVAGKSQRNGPIIKILPKPDLSNLKWETPLELLCKSLKDGVILCRLLNYFLDARKIDVWTGEGLVSAVAGLAMDAVDIAGGLVTGSTATAIGVADKTASVMPDLVGGKVVQKGIDAVDTIQEATVGRTNRIATQAGSGAQSAVTVDGPRRNIENFLDVLQDPLRMFNTGDYIVAAMVDGDEGKNGQALFSADDLLSYNRGTLQEQEKKQKRIVACLLKLGLAVSSLPGYMGVCIDEINLGTLQVGEFFGEMSLLPIKGGWRSERTVTSVQNGMLYYITRAKIEWLSSRFADLKHKLNDHVEDWEKMQALSKGHGLAILKEQLAQQSVALAEQENKLSKLDASMQTVLALCQSINARLPLPSDES